MSDFYILNSKSEYFSGMMYGGEFVWCSDIKEAKVFSEESKFTGLQRFCVVEKLSKLYLKNAPKWSEGYEFGKRRGDVGTKKEVKKKIDIQKKIDGLKKKVDKNPNWKVPLNGITVTAEQALNYYKKML